MKKELDELFDTLIDEELFTMETGNSKRTRQETIDYFKMLAYEFEKKAYREDDLIAKGKSEAYRLVVFEIERNME